MTATTSAVSVFSTTDSWATAICPGKLSIMRSVAMLSPEDKERVEGEVRRIVAQLRARPTAEKEDALGLEIATMPESEREYVPEVLLRLLAEEARLR